MVSKHSILSAQRKNKVAAMKVRVEEPAPPEMEESDSLNWFKNEALPGFAGEDPIGWISKAESFFEEEKIRSSHKTQWAFMRMEGVAQEWFFSWCQEDLDAEWESFAVDLIKRFKEPKSRKRDEVEEKKSEEVEEKMVGNDWEGREKDCTFDKEPDGDTFETKVGASHPLYDAVRSFTAPLYDTYPDEEETKRRIDWGMDRASDKEPPPEENAGEATADVVVPDHDMRESIFSLLTGSCEGEEKTRGSDEKLRDDEHWGRPPEKNAGGATATVEAEGRTSELGASFFSLHRTVAIEKEKGRMLRLNGVPGNRVWI